MTLRFNGLSLIIAKKNGAANGTKRIRQQGSPPTDRTLGETLGQSSGFWFSLKEQLQENTGHWRKSGTSQAKHMAGVLG